MTGEQERVEYIEPECRRDLRDGPRSILSLMLQLATSALRNRQNPNTKKAAL